MAEERDKLEQLLCGRLDGELSAEQAAELERRLKQDPALREELRRYAALQGHLAELGRQELRDVDYDAQLAEIMSAVERRALLRRAVVRRPLVLRPVFGIVAAAAAVLIVATVGVLNYHPAGPQGKPPGDVAQTPATPQPSVAVTVLPIAPVGAESGKISVEYPPVDVMSLPVAIASDTVAPLSPPPGTVAVSVGPIGRTSPRSPPEGPMISVLIE